MMGKVIMSGIVPPLVAPVTGIQLGTIAEGSIVKLNENGSPVEYLVVNQGKPSGSSLYDDSCDGTWLLRKDCLIYEETSSDGTVTIYKSSVWNNASNNNDYENSDIHNFLNNTFFNVYGRVEQSLIKQVKIPYRAGSGVSTTVTSGENGLYTKIFLLSATEVGFSISTIPTNEGTSLSYFSGCSTSSDDPKRIAYQDGSVVEWWLRSPFCSKMAYLSGRAIGITDTGDYFYDTCNSSYKIRPALVLPSNALVDKNTFILTGKIA